MQETEHVRVSGLPKSTIEEYGNINGVYQRKEVEYRQFFIKSKDAESTRIISDVHGKYYFVHEVECTKCPGVGDSCLRCRTCCGQGKVVYIIYQHTNGRKII